MKTYYRLAAGAALGAIALTATAPADAKPKKHATARKHTADPRDAKIRELEEKVDALTQRLDAQESAQQATAQQAQSAQAAARAAQTQASTALNQAQTAQAQATKIETQVTPPLEKALKTGWFANTTISGKAFLNVSSIHQTSTDLLGNTTDSAQNGTQTELKRFYVGIDHKFNDVFSANITTDFRYGTNGTSKDVLVYLKKAYLQAKLNPAFTIRVGEADLPWVPFAEGVYGYRYIENTLIDRTKFGTSSDWGVHVLGGFGHGLVNYQVSAINGAGYKTLSRSSNTIDVEGRVDVHPIKNVVLAVGGYAGKLGKSNDTVSVNHTATRFNALAAYTDKHVRVGVEYFTAKNWFNVQTAPEGPVPPPPAFHSDNDSGHGWSGFGSFVINPEFNVFGRYDMVKPTDVTIALTDGPVKDHYFNIGATYKPIPPIDISLVWKHENTNNGFINTSNGLIGGNDHGKYDEIGLFGQLVF